MITQELNDKIITWRRDFHKYPELSWGEFRTSTIIAAELMRLGYEVKLGTDIIDPLLVDRKSLNSATEEDRAVRQGASFRLLKKMLGYPGVVGVLDTGRSGATIGYRFDIDALSLSECKTKGHFPYDNGFASINPNVMHGCGHDAHSAIGLGLANVIMENIDSLTGKIYLIFQPAEEGVTGARAMIGKGVVGDIDYLISGHIGFNLPTGTVAATVTDFLSTKKISVEYRGVSAHAANNPHQGKNALLAACSAILNLHAIANHPDGRNLVNVGYIHCDSPINIIPSTVEFGMEVRGVNDKICEYNLDRATAIIKGAANMYGIKAKMHILAEATSAVTSDELAVVAKNAAKKVSSVNNILDTYSFSASEDFAYMMDFLQAKGGKCNYIIIGSDMVASHHNEKFSFDESALAIGVEFYYKMGLELIGR